MGLLQAFADGLKLFVKETTLPWFQHHDFLVSSILSFFEV
jgi:NADH:ubiquinone oxidoreductase subunit H